MEFLVKTQTYEGPLDLMLHLIAEKQMDILNLDINELTSQYLAYLNQMESLHLEIVSEYLTELATLMEIKSKLLLPKNDFEIEDEYQQDPRERLVARLLEYQQYKDISKNMSDLYYQRSLQFGKPMSDCVDQWLKDNDNEYFSGNAYDLVKAMNKVLRRMALTKPKEVALTHKELSTQDRVLQIQARFSSLPNTFTFNNLCDDCHNSAEVIVTFLAILDMAKLHQLYFSVDDNDTIWFTKGGLS